MVKVKGKQFSNNIITQNKMNISTSSIVSSNNVTTKEYVDEQIVENTISYSSLNLNMVANVATVGQKACNTAVIEFPLSKIMVNINGVMAKVGEGLDCYFSPNNTTIRVGGFAQKGDFLYWNSNKFDLDTNDIIDFNYLTTSDYVSLDSGTTVTLNSVYNSVVVVYNGGSGSTMNVVISGVTFVVGNVGGYFVWDIGGANHTFTSPNESFLIYVNGVGYTIWFDGFGSLIYSVSKNGYDLLTQQYISGMTSMPTIEHIDLIDALVKQIKPILINKADVVYLGNINNSNDSWRNLVKNSHHGTISGSTLVFEPYWGFSNPSGTSYVDTNYNPSTQGVKYTLNDASYSIGIFDSKKNTVTNKFVFGRGINNDYVGLKHKLTYYETYVNYGGSAYNSPSPFLDGLWGGRRVNATQVTQINQNIVNVTTASNSTAKPNGNIYLFQSNGNIDSFYIGGINFFYIGASLTDAEYTTLNNAVNDYLIQCLFLKYGLNNWGVKMAISYFLNLHNFEKYEAFEVYEFLKRHQSGYTYTPIETSINSGAVGMTDWVDSNSDGIADNWFRYYNSEVCSIVTGSTNGFTGNAQRMVGSANGTASAMSANVYLAVGRTYKVSFKYRTNNKLRLYLSSQVYLKDLPANTGTCMYHECYFTNTHTSAAPLAFYVESIGDWWEIDEVSVVEYTNSDIVTFNKCLNSGFGSGADWVDSNGDGLADGWNTIIKTTGTVSIVTGNGFKDRAQRVSSVSGRNWMYLPSCEFGKTYTLYCKYRSNEVMSVSNGTLTAPTFAVNTGNAIVGSCQFTMTVTTMPRLYNANTTTSWFEVDELLIIDSSNSQYLYNVFGPNGLNKTTCDYLMLFKSGGNLATNPWTKSGSLLRWNQDGTIANSNNMPAYTRGTNLGIVTVTSTDGWSGVTNFQLDSFYGNFPLFWKYLKTDGGKGSNTLIYYSKIKIDLTTSNVKPYLGSIYFSFNVYPGGLRLNLVDLVGGSYTAAFNFTGESTWSRIVGNLSDFTTELNVYGINIYDCPNVIGGLNNITIYDSITSIYIQRTSISIGTSTWNKNIANYNLVSNVFSTSAVNSQLSVINTYFTTTTPIKNVIINLSGASMGIPTGGANNTDLLGIIAKHTAAGFTATITVRTS